MRYLNLKTYLQLLQQAQRAAQDPTDGLRVFGPVKFHEFKNEILGFYGDFAGQFSSLISSPISEYNDHPLEMRSYHFVAIRQGKVLGVLRLTPFPFTTVDGKLPHYHRPELFRLVNGMNVRNFLEVSRFVVARGEQFHRVTERLLLASGLWSITQTHMEGFFGAFTSDNSALLASCGFNDLPESVKKHLVRDDVLEGNWIACDFEKLLSVMILSHFTKEDDSPVQVWQ